MSRDTFFFTGVRRIVLLAIVIGTTAIWATAAFAQNSAEGQYADPTATASGNPAASGNAASATSGKAASGGGGSSSKSSGGGGGKSGASKGGGGPGGRKALPATGGPLPLFITLGVLVLSSTGLLALRRSVRR